MENLQSHLSYLFDQAYEAELAFIANLTAEQRMADSAPDRWSHKDTLAHIAAWNAHEVWKMQAASQGETQPLSSDIDEINAGIYAQHQKWNWEQVMQLLDDARRDLAATLVDLSETDLTDPSRFPWTRGQPLLHRLAFTTYFHALSHIARLLWDSGEHAAGAQLAETTSLNMASLDESESWQGVQRYNLACFYALSGQRQAALDLVRQSLALRPDMARWARQDTELASLWEDPAFVEMTASGE
jgi:hypothetical protein